MLRAICALAVGLVAFLLCWSILRKQNQSQKQLQQRLKDLRQPRAAVSPQARQSKQQDASELPFKQRVLLPIEEAFERRANQLTPREMRAWLRQRIVLAGKTGQMTPGSVFAAMVLGAGMCFGLAWLYVRQQDFAFVQTLLIELLATFAGTGFPLLVLHSLIQKRQQEIMKELPEVLDLLCVSVQAGLSFDASLEKITSRMQGALIEEFRHFQDDIRMGMVRRTAMKHLADRCELQDVSLFMTSLIQAERLGTSMGQTLFNQANNIRERRRQYVKAQALKAPVKMVFPLVLFIFPALFVVTLVPTLLTLLKNL